jgi:hypothetical protein
LDVVLIGVVCTNLIAFLVLDSTLPMHADG